MRSNNKLLATIFTGVGAVLVLLFILTLEVYLARMDERTLDRAPTAVPLQTLEAALQDVASSQTVYVPVYSHVYTGGGNERRLEVTLSIRNTDVAQSIVINSIRYYDNDGELLREYLPTPVILNPLASTDFLVERRDSAGGVGANFLVEWVAEAVVTQPLIEAVMVSTEGTQAFAFARPGYPIASSRSAN